ncbi:MAG: glycerol-3-phosphate 1-O-acyltransferase PlsY [Proteobacteria bacterium]|nr:glycerol-3-phosphate 1-O-acyltransferase PlsY [Pseudomonadota bacterium]
MEVGFSYHLILVPIAYLLGSVPFGLMVARAMGGADPRSVGSGNIGATNVRRSAGKGAGIITLCLDFFKGFAPVYVAWYLGAAPFALSLVAFAAVIGHVLPVFTRFKGGKGVATACGVFGAISPGAAVLVVLSFVLIVAFKRYVSLGSIVGASLMPVFLSLMPGTRHFTVVGVAVAVVIIIRHRDNIKRLAAGTENRV